MAFSPRWSRGIGRSASPARTSAPVTFGEAVASWPKSGLGASQRHGGVFLAQQTHLPTGASTMHDLTVCNLRNSDRDPLQSLSVSQRSRTPSPWSATRHPRSLSATSRGADALRGSYAGSYAGLGSREWSGSIIATDSLPLYPGDPMTRCNSGAIAPAFGGECLTTPRSRRAEPQTFLQPAPRGAPGVEHLRAPQLSGGPASSATAPCGKEAWEHYWPPAAHPAWSSREAAAPVPAVRKVSAHGGDPRSASFARLNNFLLRTHATSLVSALAEDGWLEPRERDALCRRLRGEAGLSGCEAEPWAVAFLRIYARLMETDDVPLFVAGLRSQIL